MNGFLNINKPLGMTSFDVVAKVRKIIKEKRVGHGGTLDPAASGVLPLLLGKATRMVDYLHFFPKTYKAEIELGLTTDTWDREGSILSRFDPHHVTREEVESLLGNFRGAIGQTVPAYSAAKSQGRSLYSLARKGVAVTPRQKKVFIYESELLSWQRPFFTIKVVCGKGTYIRSIAHELGQRLGCGAILSSLQREEYGPLRLSEAISPDTLKEHFAGNQWEKDILPLDYLFRVISHVSLNSDEERVLDLGNGLKLDVNLLGNKLDVYLPAYNTDGLFLGVMKEVEGCWRWHKVFRDG